MSNGPSHVLMTADTVGGVWIYALELAGSLARRGVETVLATMGAPLREDQWEEARRVPGLRVVESAYRLEWMDEPWDDVRRAGEWLLALAEEHRPDVVHLNSYCFGALEWGAPTVVVGHSCVLSWWEAVKGEPAPPCYDRYREAVAAGLARAGAVVAPTRAMLRELEHLYGPLPLPRVVPNGRRPLGSRRGVKEPLVLCAGRLWDEAKNLTVLESVADAIEWPIYAAGDETRPGDPEAGPRDRVRTLGLLGRAEMEGWMARASIYALPARYEPFGLSALEAGLARCALVLGDIPSLREVWNDAAMFVAPDDRDALARALRELTADEKLRRAYADRAYHRARAFTPERMAVGYLSTYRHLMRLWRDGNQGTAARAAAGGHARREIGGTRDAPGG